MAHYIPFLPDEIFAGQGLEPPKIPEVHLYELVGEHYQVVRTPGDNASILVLSMISPIFIKSSELEKLIHSPELRKNLSVGQKGCLMKRYAISTVDQVFDQPTPENLDKCMKVISQMVHTFMQEPSTYLHVTKLSHHDPYTLQHSVGTGASAIMLGKKMNFKEKELNELGLAGLLHDIGKISVRREIINKPGPLDPDEWAEMKLHSEQGFKMIENQSGFSDPTKAAVLEHHEDKNGTGYPIGKPLAGLHPFSKIIAVCDVFNALTTDRPYSKAQKPFSAFQIMASKLLYKLDEPIFKELIRLYGEEL